MSEIKLIKPQIKFLDRVKKEGFLRMEHVDTVEHVRFFWKNGETAERITARKMIDSGKLIPAGDSLFGESQSYQVAP